MTNILQIDSGDQRSMWAFWLDALVPYQTKDVAAAFIAFTRGGRRYPNPQDIICQIRSEQIEIGIQLTKLKKDRDLQIEHEADQKRQDEPKASKAEIDKIMARFRK